MSEFVPFRFKVNLYNSENNQLLCSGQFSEVTGFELSMEPNAIREGAPMILKRGVTSINDLWSWFDASTRGSHYGYRLHGEIVVLGNPIEGKTENPVMTWRLEGVMATKFKGPDLNATGCPGGVCESDAGFVCCENTSGSKDPSRETSDQP